MEDTAQREEIDIGAPGGFKLGIKGNGQQILSVLLICAMAGFLAFMIWQHEQSTQSRQVETVKAWREVKDAMKAVQDTQTAQIYVLTLSEKERAKLQLNKPKVLKDLERE